MTRLSRNVRHWFNLGITVGVTCKRLTYLRWVRDCEVQGRLGSSFLPPTLCPLREGRDYRDTRSHVRSNDVRVRRVKRRLR